MRFHTTFVGGKEGFENHNPAEAVSSERIYIGLKTLLPAQKEVQCKAPEGELCVALDEPLILNTGSSKGTVLRRLDGIFTAPGELNTLRNIGSKPARLLVVSEHPCCSEQIEYLQ